MSKLDKEKYERELADRKKVLAMAREEMKKPPSDEFMTAINKTFELGMKLKKVMMKKGLRRARAKCPDCPDKYLHGSINGPRDHMHFGCDCKKYFMME